MRRVPPSLLVGAELDQLLRGELDEGTKIVSSLVDTVTRLVIQSSRGRAVRLPQRTRSRRAKSARGRPAQRV
ncbi:MAG: hypothetical protein ACLP41_16195 [Acidimicrobiales bacterium]